MALYDSGYSALNGGEGCGRYTNDDGSLSWAQSYLLGSLLDMYRGTGRTVYLDQFVRQANMVLDHADIVRGLSDYKERSTWAWSATRYSIDGSRAFWLVDDAVIVEPMVRFSAVVFADGKLRARFADPARRYLVVAEEVIAKFDDNYRTLRDEGQYTIEPGFPAAIGSPSEYRPLPLNHDAAAGELHALLWAITGSARHRTRAIAIGERLRRSLTLVGDRYVWHYWGVDGQAIFNQGWEDISHGAFDVRFATLLAERGVVFEAADLDRFARSLWIQRATDGFRRFVVTDAADVTLPDSKCGHTWLRRYSDSSGLWLDIAHSDLYDVIQEYIEGRMATPLATDPHLLAGVAKLVSNYERRITAGAP